eukprot:scaffold59337_cov35-Tisochrysis_lutea.AAC.3
MAKSGMLKRSLEFMMDRLIAKMEDMVTESPSHRWWRGGPWVPSLCFDFGSLLHLHYLGKGPADTHSIFRLWLAVGRALEAEAGPGCRCRPQTISNNKLKVAIVPLSIVPFCSPCCVLRVDVLRSCVRAPPSLRSGSVACILHRPQTQPIRASRSTAALALKIASGHACAYHQYQY